jgi:chromosome segregation ATPase
MTPHDDRKPSQPGAKPLQSGTAKSYKSPPHKLVRFFEKSRDQWKAKYLEVKTRVKRLRNRMRFLEKSKERCKARIRELEADRARLEAQVRARDHEIEEFKKNFLRLRPGSDRA